ncbi:hypothetical protein POJ06DRAFT_268148 [Lipomyces tetrasporus]|uniref:Uncharacterized protein n=1 Tax=Lipomyces tetrasporus TaxID=54092 RepID=A0AAD7QSN0_9ASCO|nr:uncharacterized protein POJ06DRAFT_268148 [Lipomyces tetrasporus]KAJ8100563.1 hypothetical protein POJ06DRAFT_268148 [Lipomyces tetrasporus]
MSNSGLASASAPNRKKIIVLVGAPLAADLPVLPEVRNNSAVPARAEEDDESIIEHASRNLDDLGADLPSKKAGESALLTKNETSHEISTPVSLRLLLTRRISYISSIPSTDHLKTFGPQYFCFLAVIMSISQPIHTKSGRFNWLTIVDSSIPYRSLVVDTREAVKPLPISVWDLEAISHTTDSCGRKWMPTIGDVVYLSDVLVQEYRGEVSGTTRRHVTRIRLLFTPKDMRDMSTLSGCEEEVALSPFSRTIREFVVELKKWVEVIENNRSMISTPEVSNAVGGRASGTR